MEEEVRRDASSTAASYWLVAATRGAGDLDRSWAAAVAAWVRAALAPDRGATLRADLDRLVTQALIPDRATPADHDRSAPGHGDDDERVGGFQTELDAAVDQPFASFQFSPIPTSTVSGTLRWTADCINSRTPPATSSAVVARRLEEQLVVDGEDHAGASRRRASEAPRCTSIIACFRMSAAVP